MKRKRISLLCAILSVTMVILLCPPIAFAEDAIPDAKMLSYEDYFEFGDIANGGNKET